MTLGARVIKTGLAISLSLYICSQLGLEPAVWAAIAAIIIMQPSLYGTWRHVWEQLQTNTLGAAIAFLAIHFIGNDLFSIGIVAIIVIVLSVKMGMEKTIGLTLVTVLVIMETPGADLFYAINRFSIILIGIASALIVNVAIAPPNFRKMFEEKMQDVFSDLSLLLRRAVSDDMTEQAFKQNQHSFLNGLKKCLEMYEEFDEQRRKMAKIKPINARQIVVYKHMISTLQKGELILELVAEHYFQYKNHEQFEETFQDHLTSLISFHEYILLKYDGKMKQDAQHAELIAEQNREFFKQMIRLSHDDLSEERLRLITISSAIYEYGLHLRRLDRLVEHWLRKKPKQKTRAKARRNSA